MLTKDNITVVPKSPCFSLFSRLKIKLKSIHSEVTEIESLVVHNILREHDFPDAFKKWKKCWERCVRVEGGYFGGDGGQ
jgi:hypothetical protein